MSSVPESHFESPADLRRYEALLQMADLLTHHGNLLDLFRELANRLRSALAFDFANFSLHDEILNVMQRHVWEEGDMSPVFEPANIEESACGWVWKNQQVIAIQDVAEEQRFPQTISTVRKRGIHSYCILPLTTFERRIGALGIGSMQVGACRGADLQFLKRVANLTAMAVENVMTRQALHEEKGRLQTLVEVNKTLVSSLDLHRLFALIADNINRVVPHQFASVALYDSEKQGAEAWVLSPPPDSPADSASSLEAAKIPIGSAAVSRELRMYRRDELGLFGQNFAGRVLDAGISTVCSIPLQTSTGLLGTLNVGSTQENAFSEQDQALLQQVAAQVAIALDNARAYREIAELRDRLAGEKLYLEHEIRTELNFEEIVGDSAPLRRVLSQAKIVAASNATVLILGDTGTGKELIARAIHRMSQRKDASFIKMNCAAIPTGLLESELFGHEKGSFTGAVSQKVGRLELADGGTLFLDEVGDIPLELQPKLLRVLQDQEFERLGGSKTIRVNIRLLAATNQDLAKAVIDKDFRSDLYYRLRVFPIHLPTLHERAEDIPLLVRYFVRKFARRMDKRIEIIPSETMAAFVRWEWPGNVRELENFIERSVILTEGSVLRAPLAELMLESKVETVPDSTLERAEREHIIRVLRETRGLVSGPHGAAAKLGLKRTTLQSKMQKLGISRRDYTE